LLVILISACKQDNDAEPKIRFSGISMMDINAQPMSNKDSTDWITGDVWKSQETGLFDNISYQVNCATQHSNKIIVYPNPCNGIFQMLIDKLPTTRMELRIVDENFNKLLSIDTITNNSFTLDAKAGSLKDTVRVYYRFIEGNCEFRGHGDILVQ